jgi:hypothetical protein
MFGLLGKRLRRAARAAAPLLLLLGCGFEPEGDVPMSPPEIYRSWWASTESCSGRTGDFDRIRWYTVDGYGFDCPSGRCAGRWQSDGRIIIAGDWTRHEMVVRHEMLHELMRRSGHPNPPFGNGCPLTWETWLTSPKPGPALAEAPRLLD